MCYISDYILYLSGASGLVVCLELQLYGFFLIGELMLEQYPLQHLIGIHLGPLISCQNLQVSGSGQPANVVHPGSLVCAK